MSNSHLPPWPEFNSVRVRSALGIELKEKVLSESEFKKWCDDTFEGAVEVFGGDRSDGSEGARGWIWGAVAEPDRDTHRALLLRPRPIDDRVTRDEIRKIREEYAHKGSEDELLALRELLDRIEKGGLK